MTWDMISEMHRAGVTIGSHTRRHALLTHETPDTVVDELVASREQLERKLGVPSRCFAYPDGQFNPAVVTAVAAAGYGLAFTTCRHRDACYPTLTVSRRVLWEHSMATTAARFSSSIASCHVNGFFDFVHLEQTAACVLSDSGTVQEETCLLGVPNVTVREVTERPETIECGSNMLAGTDPQAIRRAVAFVLDRSNCWTPPPEYLATHVAQTVVRIVTGHRRGRRI